MADQAVESQEEKSVPSTNNALVEYHLIDKTPTINEPLNRTDRAYEDDSTDSISHSTTGSSYFIGCSKSSQYSTSDKHLDSKKRKKLKGSCMLLSLGVLIFLVLLSAVVALSLLLHFEKQESKLLVNELYSKQELLKCFENRSNANLCPRRSVAAPLLCSTVTEIRTICPPHVSG